MGIVLDSSVLVAYERSRFDLERLLTDHASPAIAAVTAAELLIDVERANTAERRTRRQVFVENLFSRLPIIPFDLDEARIYAVQFATLTARGETIGDRDLQIAVTALRLDYDLATLNTREFQRVAGLRLVEVSKYGVLP